MVSNEFNHSPWPIIFLFSLYALGVIMACIKRNHPIVYGLSEIAVSVGLGFKFFHDFDSKQSGLSAIMLVYFIVRGFDNIATGYLKR